MAITASCPNCAKTYRVRDELAGKKVRCKECGAAVPIPAADSAAAEAAPLPTPARVAPPAPVANPPRTPPAAPAPALRNMPPEQPAPAASESAYDPLDFMNSSAPVTEPVPDDLDLGPEIPAMAAPIAAGPAVTARPPQRAAGGPPATTALAGSNSDIDARVARAKKMMVILGSIVMLLVIAGAVAGFFVFKSGIASGLIGKPIALNIRVNGSTDDAGNRKRLIEAATRTLSNSGWRVQEGAKARIDIKAQSIRVLGRARVEDVQLEVTMTGTSGRTMEAITTTYQGGPPGDPAARTKGWDAAVEKLGLMKLPRVEADRP